MRLKKEQIHVIGQKILKDLEAKKLALLKADRAKILERIERAISDDLLAEARLDEEVKTIMEQYRSAIASGQMNQQEVFQKIKKQLIKERKLVI